MHPDLPPPTLVQDARGFERLLRLLDRVDELAVDTEADSFFSYREKVCLIQVTADEQDFLIDPLAGFDVSGLGDVLADPRKLKVFHDGEYDILIMKREYRFEFQNLFDTRVAAATLGTQAPGLAAVLNDRFQITLDKSMQRSDWGVRPLSDKQIRYARLDTRFLLPLMREQQADLAERGRAMIVEGECRRLEAITPPDSRFNPDEFVRLKGSRTLGPVERQVLREVFIARERLAEASNQPPFRILNPDSLVDLAQLKPRTREGLTRVRGFTEKQVRRIGGDMLDAVTRGLELGPLKKFPSLPSRDGTHELSDEETELHERLKNWRKTVAVQWGIDSAYLLNRHVLLRLAKGAPETPEAVARIEGIQDWQRDEFASAIADVVRKFVAEVRAGTWQPKRRRGARRSDDTADMYAND
ncbi:MAG: HRDC domain-containing protein [Planctomycetes bacterium]|nr:HRDC domain-containing protein [Planctomycetota bacterium]